MKTIILVVIVCLQVVFSWDLEPKDVTAFTGDTGKIRCLITPTENDTTKVFHTWMTNVFTESEAEELLYFDSAKAQQYERVSASFGDEEMWLQIENITLGDEGDYRCNLLGLKPPIREVASLTVHQLPVVSIEDIVIEAYHNSRAAVARCVANGSKPAPTMWFTNEAGEKVDVLESTQTVVHDNNVVDSVLVLERVFDRSDNGQKYTCNVRHPNNNAVSTALTEPVNVVYAATAWIPNMNRNEYKVVSQNSPFEARCETDGNPAPAVTWEFTPDESINITMDDLPSNFEVSYDGSRLSSGSVTLTDEYSTNNGTFTCKVSNGIGDGVSFSFRLGVYALPPTTVATTAEVTPVVEPQRSSSDAAVIGGVVAVAVFVLIVAIVLVVRYFMSHKGTYHTHEMKTGDVEENRRDSMDEEGRMLEDNENELGEKKRTEYFM